MSEKDLQMIQKGIMLVLEQISKEELQKRIQTDDYPVIWDYDIPKFVVDILREYKEEVLPYITYDNLMELAPEYKPEFIPLMKSKQGENYMKNLLGLLRFWIENINLNRKQLDKKLAVALSGKGGAESMSSEGKREEVKLEKVEEDKIDKKVNYMDWIS